MPWRDKLDKRKTKMNNDHNGQLATCGNKLRERDEVVNDFYPPTKCHWTHVHTYSSIALSPA